MHFRPLRRSRQALSLPEAEAILAQCSHGILACLGDDSYPYAVPLNYVYHQGKIYLHSAKEGHKIDAIKSHSKVSFAVVGQDTIVSKEYTSYFSSVIVFGEARIITGQERLTAFGVLTAKYSPDQSEEDRERVIQHCQQAEIIAIDIHHLSGKQSRELMQNP